jgi:hypothetical protein
LNFDIVATTKGKGPEKINGITLAFTKDSIKVSVIKYDKILNEYNWTFDKTFSNDVRSEKNNSNISDSVKVFSYDDPGEYTITLEQDNGLTETKYLKIFDNQKAYDDYIDYVNSQRGQILGNSRQNPRKFKFNSPKDSYIYSNSSFSKTDSIEFEVLDDINALLDTAIYLYNQGNATKASQYVEQTLFGNKPTKNQKDGVKIEDYRKGFYDGKTYDPKTAAQVNGIPFASGSSDIEQAIFGEEVGLYYLPLTYVYDGGVKIEDDPVWKASAAFKEDYLEYRFKNFKQDPNVTNWILTLRNGLTEFVKETRGQQRWRNVTEDENAGRLNYRKDDYINYLDGDLESSIYYNNQKKIDDINNGRRDSKQAVYQSEFENYDLTGSEVNSGASGWPTTLISDKSRVYKGGSWADRAYWLSPGNRRFYDEDKSSAMIGFRCAMDRLGSSRANSKKK